MAGLFPGLHARALRFQRPRVPPVHAIEDCHCAATATLLWVCSLVGPASKPVQMSRKVSDGIKSGARCAAGFRAGRCRLRVTTGHSAMSAQCPVCAKADTAGRFMSTPP